MNEKLLNTQIEALDRKHGAEIVQFYKDNGFNVGLFAGSESKEDNSECRWYGVDIKGFFDNREKESSNIKTITLEEAKTLVNNTGIFKNDASLKNRWIKATKNNTHCIPILRGEYLQLDGNSGTCDITNDKSKTWCLSEINLKYWELMPKDFNPYNQSEIKIGTKLKALTNYPDGGIVKKDEIGDVVQITSSIFYVDFPHHKRYACSKIFIGTKYEIISEEITNTFGLKIGDTLPEKVIRTWSNENNNYSYGKTWSKEISMFNGDRRVKSFKIINGVLGFEVSNTATIYLKAEGFKEFMDNFDKPKIETQFEVGKWYKTGFGSIVKYKETTSDNTFIASEHFMFDDLKKLLSTEAKFGTSNIKNFTPLTDLSEIQPYLPDGHVDKITNVTSSFKLPEKWAVKPSKTSTYERDSVRDWFNSLRKSTSLYMKGGESEFYWHFREDNYCNIRLHSSYELIPFELFEKEVLNKQTDPNANKRVEEIFKEPSKLESHKSVIIDFSKDVLTKKPKPNLTINDIPTTQPIVIKLNKKINYLIPKSI